MCLICFVLFKLHGHLCLLIFLNAVKQTELDRRSVPVKLSSIWSGFLPYFLLSQFRTISRANRCSVLMFPGPGPYRRQDSCVSNWKKLHQHHILRPVGVALYSLGLVKEKAAKCFVNCFFLFKRVKRSLTYATHSFLS